MKLEQSFSDFLKNTVNLNKTRVDVAESGIKTIETFLKENELFKNIFIDIKTQGSFRQETIIKPVDSETDFDVDLLLEVKEVDGWVPKDYLLKLSKEFKDTDRYKDLVDTRGKERCVTIDYQSDFHIDIVPAVKIGGIYKIMNKVTNEYEETDGDGYAEWFASKNEITGKKYLTKVTRLIKYIRDTKSSFDVKSVLLTTLLGNQVYVSDQKENAYPDLPTAFITILTRLDLFLQANSDMPKVENPILQTEDFNRKWNQEKYFKFREEIHKIRNLAADAFNENDETKSLEKWQKIFGEDFTISTDKGLNQEREVVISQEDKSAIILGDYSHKENPQWPKNIEGIVEIKKCMVNDKYAISSNGWPIPDGCSLNYVAEVSGIIEPYEVWWQVVNTGEHAASPDQNGLNGLRGKFDRPKNLNRPLEQTESSLYTGKHWIQCFIVKNGYLIAESKPFFLNVVNKTRKRFKTRG